MGIMQGEDKKTPDAGAAVVRGLSADDVAKALGMTSRAVREWADPDGVFAGRQCPSDAVPARRGPKGGVSRRFNLDEVKRWCAHHGVGRRRGGDPAPMFELVEGEVTGGTPVPLVEKAGKAEPTPSPLPLGGGADAQALASGPSPLAPAPAVIVMESADQGLRLVAAMMQSLQDVVLALLENGRRFAATGVMDNLSAATLRSATDAATMLSKEVRMLKEAEDAARERRGEVVARDSARAAVEAVVNAIESALRQTPQDVATEILADQVIGAALARADIERETGERLLVACAERIIARVRATSAEELAKLHEAAGKVGSGGEAVGVGGMGVAA